jgi:hypothetical protein
MPGRQHAGPDSQAKHFVPAGEASANGLARVNAVLSGSHALFAEHGTCSIARHGVVAVHVSA